MKNTLTDLNNYLFEELERLNDDSISDERLQVEIQKADAVTKVCETIISNSNLALKTVSLMNDYGVDPVNPTKVLPFFGDENGTA